MAFYYPDKEEPWDILCGSSFLGNFYPQEEVLWLTAYSTERKFQNAEAAFQALKFWPQADRFEGSTGDEAFRLKQQLKGQEDWTYGGYGSNWKGMYAVLRAKFKPGSSLASALLETGDAFLLEHNSRQGRDSVWSDNMDGTGTNWLGLQLMLLREELTPNSTVSWTEWLQAHVDIGTGTPQTREWQAAVLAAATAVQQQIVA